MNIGSPLDLSNLSLNSPPSSPLMSPGARSSIGSTSSVTDFHTAVEQIFELSTHKKEYFFVILNIMTAFDPDDIPEALLFDNEITQQEFDTFIQLFEDRFLLYRNRDTKTITIDRSFHFWAKKEYHKEVARSGFAYTNEYIANRLAEIASFLSPSFFSRHLKPYLEQAGQNFYSIEHQVLLQYLQNGPKPLVEIWNQRFIEQKKLERIKDEPYRSISYCKMGKLSLEIGDIPVAKKELERAFSKLRPPSDRIPSPFYNACTKTYALFLSRIEKYSESNNLISSIYAGETELQLLWIKNTLYLNDFEPAVSELNKIPKSERTNPDVMALWGLYYLKTGQNEQASAFFVQAEAIYSENSANLDKQFEVMLLNLLTLPNKNQLHTATSVKSLIQKEFGSLHPLYYNALYLVSAFSEREKVPNRKELRQEVSKLQKLLQPAK